MEMELIMVLPELRLIEWKRILQNGDIQILLIPFESVFRTPKTAQEELW